MCPCLSLLLLLLPPNAPTMRSLRPYNRPAECLAIRRFFIRVLFFDALRSALLSFSTAWVREGDLFEVFTSVHSKSQKRGKEKRKIIKRATCQTFAASKVVSFFFSKGKKGSQWRVILPLDLFPFRTWSWWKFYFRLLNKVCVSLIHIWCRHHLFLFFYQNVEPSDAAVWSCQRFVRHACFHHSLLEMWTDEGFLLCPKVEPQNSLPVYSFMFTIFRHFSFRE